MSNSALSKYKEKISLYEDSLAPLTSNQRQFIFDITHGDIQRPTPQRIKENISKKLKIEEIQSDGDGIRWDLFSFKTKQEFNEWFVEIESELEEDKNRNVNSFIEALEGCDNQKREFLDQVINILEDLHTLQENYHFVSNKTNSLHNSCQQLLLEQEKLEEVSLEIDSNLKHFLQLDRIASKLSSSSLLVTSDGFFSILENIDSCLSFMIHNPSYKESNIYAAKYKHCLNKAISHIKIYLNRVLQETTSTVQAQCLEEMKILENGQVGDQSQNQDTIAFPFIYGKFSAGIAKLKKLFTEVEKRRNGWPEYGELFSDVQQSFFKERSTLLNGSVWAMVNELNTRGKTGVDLCSTVRSGCSFCIHLCQDEFRLFGDFFSGQYTVLFDDFMESLMTPLYETLRPLIIKIQHLETLAELCSILRIEMLEEQGGTGIGGNNPTGPTGLNSFVRIVSQLLQDTQERLVYRAHIYISTDIRNYNPGPGDLAYPEKLEMMEQIAESLENQHNDNQMRSLARSNSQSSLISLSSITSQEVAAINAAAALQIPRPLKSSSSPADLHGMWFPSVRRTLLCLSKLYRCLDKAIFQGLSQEALSACIANVSTSAISIAASKTMVDGQLFEIKHLLILREQIAPFQVEFAIKEMSLDFSYSRVKIAALSLLQKKKQLFSLGSTNSLLEFIVEGTPQVKEYFLDSKKEVDRQLKGTCEHFIAHSTQLLTGQIRDFINKATKVLEAQKEKPDIILSQQSFALPNILSQLITDAVDGLRSKLPFINRSMKLYLANRETEFILFRPVKNNVLNAYLQLENIVLVNYSGTNISCPTQEQISILISSVIIQNDQK